jgi:hypothetical protein
MGSRSRSLGCGFVGRRFCLGAFQPGWPDCASVQGVRRAPTINAALVRHDCIQDRSAGLVGDAPSLRERLIELEIIFSHSVRRKAFFKFGAHSSTIDRAKAANSGECLFLICSSEAMMPTHPIAYRAGFFLNMNRRLFSFV